MTTKTARRRPTLLHQVLRTIKDRQLFSPGHHLLVAVSGGPDSIALLSLMATVAPSWRLRLTVIHFNYGLRESESDGDEAFVTSFCRSRNIPVIVRRPVLSRQRRVSSLQMLARRARYEAMKSLAHEIGADRILTGHTANDQAETMLLWMLRGAGLPGLAGMPFIREQLIVRPLLKTTRKEVLTYLGEEGLSYRQDSSNLTGRYRRNRVRHDLLPMMTEITPAVVRVLARQAEVLRADDEYLSQVVDGLYRSMVTVDTEGSQRFEGRALAMLPDALKRRVVRHILQQTDSERRAPSLRAVDSVLRFVSGRSQSMRLSVGRAEVMKERDRIVVVRRHGQATAHPRTTAQAAAPLTIAVPSTVYWPGTGQEIHVQEMTRQAAEPYLAQRNRDCAVFDAARVSAPLVLRAWQPGDRLYPHGMGGKRKKLQDYFTDVKLSREERTRVPLLAAPQGILWVVGHRQDERFMARKNTSRCLVARVHRVARREGAA